MTSRQIHLLLSTAAAMLFIVAIGGLFVGLRRDAEVAPSVVDTREVKSSSTTQPSISPSADQSLWARPLRRLEKGGSKSNEPVASASAAPSPIALTLVGTVGHSLALVQTPGGSVELCGVGEKIGAAEILSIMPSRVEVRTDGQTIVLIKQPLDMLGMER